MATINCLLAAELPVTRGKSCGPHTHPCTEIVYYRGCVGWAIQGSHRRRYFDGAVSVYQPHLSHDDHCTKSGTAICCGVTGCDAESLPVGLWRASAGVRQAALALGDELRRRDAVHTTALELRCGLLVTELHRMLARTPSVSTHVTAAKTIFDSRFAEKLSVRRVAHELSINPDYLRHLFRQQLGESPIQYLLRKRMEYAGELLHWTDEPIKEIAARVGLENPYYFSRLFRKWTGQTPSAYRLRCQSASRRKSPHWPPT